MPMTLSLNEASSHFRDVVFTIERDHLPYMIMDGDRPVAQIVPMPSHRKIVPAEGASLLGMAGLALKRKIAKASGESLKEAAGKLAAFFLHCSA